MENEWQQQAKAHAIKNKTEEVCGLIVSKNNNLLYIGARNISENKNTNFAVDPNSYIYAASLGKIIACFHSHIKNTSFSWSDINNSFKLNLPYNTFKYKKYKSSVKEFVII